MTLFREPASSSSFGNRSTQYIHIDLRVCGVYICALKITLQKISSSLSYSIKKIYNKDKGKILKQSMLKSSINSGKGGDKGACCGNL